MRRIVITIHGINTDGAWQEQTEHVLRPHFQVRAVKYDSYRKLGFSKQLVNPWWAAVVVAGICMPLQMPIRGYAIASGGVLLLSLAAYLRNKTFKNVRAQIESYTNECVERPHFVAHSFGTYLLGRTFYKFPFRHAEHMILLGTVLARRYPWTVVARERKQIRAATNEVAKLDPVMFGSTLISPIVKHMGGAGRWGFKNNRELVHRFQNWDKKCEVCVNESQEGVHNLVFEQYMHSDAHLTPEHARAVWLPLLLGIPPGAHSDLTEQCAHLRRLEEEKRWPELADKEAEFRSARFSWTSKLTLEEYIRKQMIIEVARGDRLLDDHSFAHAVSRAVRGLWRLVADAVTADRRAMDLAQANQLAALPELDERRRCLDPQIAAMRAVDGILQEVS